MIIIYQLLFVFLITFNIWGNFVPGANYYDELITICAIILMMVRSNRLYIKKYEKKIIYSLLAVWAIGILATVKYHIQPQFAGVWRDMLAISKFPICYYAFYTRTPDIKASKICKSVVPISKLLISIILFFGFVNLFLHIPFLSGGERYGLPIYRFLYSHETFLVSSLICLIAVLIAHNSRKNILYILGGMVAVAMTLKSKPILVLLFIVASLFLRSRHKFRVTKFQMALMAVVVGVLTLYLASGQLNTYIGFGETAARGAFYLYGVDVAIRFFPLGSGFCTFASSLSHKYYSPLYYEYGMENINGITEDDGSYAGDTFWPNIYAQYGFLGFFIYLFLFICILKSITRRFFQFSNGWIASMSILLYGLTASFAESFFTNDSSVVFAVVLAIYIGNDDNNRKK